MNIVEVGYRSEGAHQWLARLYQPEGSGPFPVLVDVHGGAWNGGDRMSDDFMNLRLAGSGILVMAIDFRLAPAHPYPAQAQDANYAFRWAKAHAAEYHGDPASVGALGASSGGHTVLLNALRPLDPLYAALELNETTKVDASWRMPSQCGGCWTRTSDTSMPRNTDRTSRRTPRPILPMRKRCAGAALRGCWTAASPRRCHRCW